MNSFLFLKRKPDKINKHVKRTCLSNQENVHENNKITFHK